MSRFRIVEIYPTSGWWQQAWIEGDADADAFAKVSRGICDLYSADLATANLQHRVSTLRIFVGEVANTVGNQAGNLPPATEGGRAGVLAPSHTGSPESFEQAGICVPAGFASWTVAEQQRCVLEAVHEAARGVAEFRQLPIAAFEHARAAVQAANYTFTWSGPWKSSPGRRWRARCTFRTLPDGFGRLVLHVVASGDESVRASSSEQVAWSTQEGFQRAAKSLRWIAPDRLEVVPCVGVHGLAGGSFVAILESERLPPKLTVVQVADPPGRAGTTGSHAPN